jgi:FkbM family methyltransferase
MNEHELFSKRPFLRWGFEHEIGCSNDKEDEFYLELLSKNNNKKLLIDIGAADGITGSNSYRAITKHNWSAILVEPLKPFYDYLKLLHGENKNVRILNFACDNEEKETEIKYRNFDEAIGLSSLIYDWENKQKIQTKLFSSLVSEKEIDFLSLDTEGKDLDIVKTIDFNFYNIKIICIEKEENFLYNLEIKNFLELKNFKFTKETNHNYIFVNKNMI